MGDVTISGDGGNIIANDSKLIVSIVESNERVIQSLLGIIERQRATIEHLNLQLTNQINQIDNP